MFVEPVGFTALAPEVGNLFLLFLFLISLSTGLSVSLIFSKSHRFFSWHPCPALAASGNCCFMYYALSKKFF